MDKRIQDIRHTGKKQTLLRGDPDLLARQVKLTEEVGELAQAVLGMLSHPNASKRASSSFEDVLEEAVDVTICALDIFFTAGGTPEDLVDLLSSKTYKWKEKIRAESDRRSTFE